VLRLEVAFCERNLRNARETHSGERRPCVKVGDFRESERNIEFSKQEQEREIK
jgi:hypothetical protein